MCLYPQKKYDTTQYRLFFAKWCLCREADIDAPEFGPVISIKIGGISC